MQEIVIINDNYDDRKSTEKIVAALSGYKLNIKQFSSVFDFHDLYKNDKAFRESVISVIVRDTKFSEIGEVILKENQGRRISVTAYNLDDLEKRTIENFIKDYIKNLESVYDLNLTEKNPNFSYDTKSGIISYKEKKAELSNYENLIFAMLWESEGYYISKYDLENEIWGTNFYENNAINVNISRIRKKLTELDSKFADSIVVKKGIGWKFVLPDNL